MAGKKDVVWVADRIVTQMQSSLSAKLDDLESEYNDGISLPDIPNSRMFVAEKVRLPGTPMLVIMPDRSDPVPNSGENRYGIEYHYLTAAVVDGGNLDEDRLKRRLGRYVRAIQEVFVDERTLSGSVTDVIVVGKDYGPMLNAGGSNLVQEGQVNVRALTH